MSPQCAVTNGVRQAAAADWPLAWALPCHSFPVETPAVSSAENQLIAQLPRKDRQSLLAACVSVRLELGEVLCQAGKFTSHVYFPVSGYVSMLAEVAGHPGLEVGLVGREGMIGASLSLGVDRSPLLAMVQGAGSARRMSSADFLLELAQNKKLQSQVGRYLYINMVQLASTATCLRYHLIGPRLARWLLMTQDRARASRFHMTHELLARMLGVRRVGITVAAGALQRQGLIAYHRGNIEVIDRLGLEAAACGCYEADCRTSSLAGAQRPG